MKKLFLIILAIFICYGSNAQLKMASSGNFAIASSPSPNNYTKLGIDFAPASVSGSSKDYTFSVNNTLYTSAGAYNYGIFASTCNSTAQNQGRAYGVYGQAGNSSSGYNYGVYGAFIGSQSYGAGVYGASSGNADMNVAGNWAGFFNGSLNIEGALYLYRSWYASDKRLKKNILPIAASVSEKISQLNAVEFHYKTKKELVADGILLVSDTAKAEFQDDPDINKLQYGFLAQDVQEIFPELVYAKENGVLGINYIGLIPLMLEELKLQESKITQLQSDLDNCCKSSEKSIITTENDKISNTDAILFQNVPNPFSKETQIKCYIPNNAVESSIYIYDMQGTQLKKINIKSKGESFVAIQGSELKAGLYMYSLIVDGKEISTKKMILTN
jgi:hypothetical protein